MSQPRLHFRLPGTWHRIDLAGGDASERSIKSVVRDVIGVADDRAHVREQMRRELRTAVESARQAEAKSLMFSTEIAPGSPLPVSLGVYAPRKLHMSPSVGTAPAAVLGVFAQGVRRSQPELAGSLTDVTAAGGPAIRTHTVAPIEIPDEDTGASRLVADYWIPVPDSKQVVMVRLSTPMGELENIMLSLFDALVTAAYFKAPTAAQRYFAN